tara:strand:+ start:346 stop:858 length:513 start_codon:yes stop_codon:yes gene_type:complete
MTDVSATLVAKLAHLSPTDETARVLAQRADLVALSDASAEAVLAPQDPGGLSHAVRGIIAVRASERLGDETMKDHYYERFTTCEDWYDVAGLADPAAFSVDARLDALLRHADKLIAEPRNATRDDVEALKAAGVAEADIVRLAELCAFLGYQSRLVIGLRLMNTMTEKKP